MTSAEPFCEKASPKTHASMFSGVGGFDLALQRVGFQTVWANDIDKYACRIYRKNLDGSVLVEGDIREVDAKTVPDHDLLSAGFPCQAFSIAGKRKGIGESRGTLFYHIYRVAKVKRPKLLLLENVKGLLSNDSGRTFATIIRLLEGLGYLIEWQVLNSKHFGVPQNRERVFIIGHSRDGASKQVFPIGETCELFAGETKNQSKIGEASTLEATYGKTKNLSNMVYHQNKSGNVALHEEAQALRSRASHSYQGIIESALWHSRGFETRKDGVSHAIKGGGGGGSKVHLLQVGEIWEGSQCRVYNPDGIAPTVHKTGGNTEPLIVTAQALQTDGFLRQGSSFGTDLPQSARNIRRLTPVECERLQGFPDNYTEGVSDTQRYKLLGNAVTVNVIEFLGHKLKEALQQ